jgi:hypothetical protein
MWRTALGLVFLGFGCSSLKDPSDGTFPSDASTPPSDSGASSSGTATDSGREGTTSSGGTATGPGPFGALPSGYCCSQDSECRFRRCLDIGGAKRCADVCETEGGCNGGIAPMTCIGVTATDEGHCEPKAPDACVPAAQFVPGTKPIGACCAATNDLRSGLECAGGNCGASGDDTNPYVCTNVCGAEAVCPGTHQCLTLRTNMKICVHLAKTYTCKE